MDCAAVTTSVPMEWDFHAHSVVSILEQGLVRPRGLVIIGEHVNYHHYTFRYFLHFK